MSGSVLLDTNIVIGLFAGDPAVLAHLSQANHIFIPSIVLGELYFGAYKSAHSDQNIRRIAEFIQMSARSKRYCVKEGGRYRRTISGSRH